MAQDQPVAAYDSSSIAHHNSSISGEVDEVLDLSPIDPRGLSMDSWRRSEPSETHSNQPSSPSTSQVRKLFSDYNGSSSESNLESPLKRLNTTSPDRSELTNKSSSDSVPSESTIENPDNQLTASVQNAEVKSPSVTSSPPLAIPLPQKSEIPALRKENGNGDLNVPSFTNKRDRRGSITSSSFDSQGSFETSFRPKAPLDCTKDANNHNTPVSTNNKLKESSDSCAVGSSSTRSSPNCNAHNGLASGKQVPDREESNFPRNGDQTNTSDESIFNGKCVSLGNQYPPMDSYTESEDRPDSFPYVTVRKFHPGAKAREIMTLPQGESDNVYSHHVDSEDVDFSGAHDTRDSDQGSCNSSTISHNTCNETTSSPKKSTQSSMYPNSSSSDCRDQSTVPSSQPVFHGELRSKTNGHGNNKGKFINSEAVTDTDSSLSTVFRKRTSVDRLVPRKAQTAERMQSMRKHLSSEESLPHKPPLFSRSHLDEDSHAYDSESERRAGSARSEQSEEDYAADVSPVDSHEFGNARSAPLNYQSLSKAPYEAQLSMSLEPSMNEDLALVESDVNLSGTHDRTSAMLENENSTAQGTNSIENGQDQPEEEDNFFPKTPRAPAHSLVQGSRNSASEMSSLITKFKKVSMAEPQRISLDRRMSQSPAKVESNKMTLRDQLSVVDKVQKENFGLKLKISMMEKQLADRSDEHQQLLQNEYENLKNVNARMALEVKALRSQVEALKTSRNGASAGSDEDKDAFLVTEDNFNFQKVVEDKNSCISDLQNERNNLLKEIMELRADNELLQGKGLDDEMVSKSEYVELQRKYHELDSVQRLSSQQQNTATVHMQDEIDRLRMKLSDQTLDSRDLFNENRSLKRELAQYEIDHQSLENELNVLFKKLKVSQQEIRVLSEEVEFLKEALEEKENCLMDERAEFANLQRYAEEAREGLIEYQEELKKEQDAKKVLVSRCNVDGTLQRDINTLKAALDAKSSQLEESVKAHRLELEEAEREAQTLRAKIQSEQNQSESLKGDLERIIHLLSNVDGLIHSIDSSKRSGVVKAVSKLCALLNQYKEETADLQGILRDKDETVAERDQALENLTNELQRVSDLYEKQRLLKQSIDPSSTTKTSDAARTKTLERELQKAKQEHTDALTALHKELSKIMGPDWNEKIGSLLGQPDSEGLQKSLVKTLKTINRRFAELQSHCEALKERLSAFTESVGDKMGVSTARMVELEKRADDAIQDRSRAEQARLKTENRLLKVELSRALKELGPSDSKRSSASLPADSRRNSSENLKADRRISSLGSSTSTAVNSDVTETVDPSTTKRWELRLRELDRRLKLERELRVIERDGAENMIVKTIKENKELKRMIEQDKSGLRPALLSSISTSLPQASTSPPSSTATGHPVPLHLSEK